MNKEVSNKKLFVILLFMIFFTVIAELSGHSQSMFNGAILTGIIILVVGDSK